MLTFPKVIFIGTNEFAINTLKKILIHNYNIIGVITIPDLLKNKKLIQSPIKKFAVKQNLNIIQPKNLKDIVFINNIKKLKPDIQIVVSFKILPEEIWKIPPLGTINLHPSFLPEYRGPAPINWAIMNGEKQTGVTTFIIDNNIDKGNIILQKKVKIFSSENFENLSKRLSLIGSDLVIKTIEILLSNKNICFIKNKNKNIKYAPKIYNKDCRINWNNSIDSIFNKIRALSPYPGAWTLLKLNNKNLIFKIYKASFIKENNNKNIGKIIIKDSNMIVPLSTGYIFITEAQISGKKKLNIKDLINGIKNKKEIYIL